MSECIFCKIIKKDIPAEFIYENDAVVAFKDIKPAAPFHYLIVPKKHVDSIARLEKNHQTDIAAVIYAAKEIAETLGLKGYKLVFNVGREGGQIIDHLHLHLLGGWGNQSDIDRMPYPALDK